MNYFVDLLPDSNLLEKVGNEDNIIFNLYVKQLPSMNIHKELYYDLDKALEVAKKLKNQNKKINLIFDTFCFGNKEFTSKGKEKLEILDEFLNLKIDYATVTNNFFFNYIKKRYRECKVIISEYSDIINSQKIDRFLNDMQADGVKLDLKLIKNLEQMEQIKNDFDVNSIHINVNKEFYEDDIFKDALNNSLAHYIEDEKWDEVSKTIDIHKKENENNKKLVLTDTECKKLKDMGFVNFWYYYNG